MIIGGFQKISFIDYSEKISAVIFTQGCNFRCLYCYNIELVEPKKFQKPLLLEDIIFFLKKRIGKLDGVVITGGEPTLQKDLIETIYHIKKLGYFIKIDTNGSNPEILKYVLQNKIIDYIAMDIKAPPICIYNRNKIIENKYISITRSNLKLEDIIYSIELILSSKIAHEFRTTIIHGYFNMEDYYQIGKAIKGANKYVLQKLFFTEVLDPNIFKNHFSLKENFFEISKLFKKYVKNVIIR